LFREIKFKPHDFTAIKYSFGKELKYKYLFQMCTHVQYFKSFNGGSFILKIKCLD
jgi:hypothetical protein